LKLVWTETGEQSLEQIYDRLRGYSDQAASVWMARIRRTARTIVDYPRRGRVIPEVGEDHFRELFVGRYRLWYRIRDDQQRVEIFLVFDGRRQVPD
jgi:plasmid stabilization system protein ParE